MNNIDIKLGFYGNEDQPKKKKDKKVGGFIRRKPIEKYELKGWIEECSLDPDTKEELLKELHRYPSSALNFFYENIIIKVSEARKKLKQRQD